MSRGATGPLVLALSLVIQAPSALAQGRAPCAACLALVVPASQIGALPAQLNGVDFLVPVNAEALGEAVVALDRIAAGGGRPGVLIRGLPDVPIPADVISRAATVIVDAETSRFDPAALTFKLKTSVTAIRALAAREVQVGFRGPRSLVGALAHDLAPYVDFILTDADLTIENATAIWAPKGEWTDLKSALAITEQGNARRWVWEAPTDAVRARSAVEDLVRAAPLLTEGLVPSPGRHVQCDGRAATIYVIPKSLDEVAWLDRCAASDEIVVQPPLAIGERVQVAGDSAVVRLPAEDLTRFAEGVAVSAEKRLTVDEIVARHQAAARRQAGRVGTLIASGTLTVVFEAPGFPAPVTITSETTTFTDSQRTDIVQRAIRVNGIAFTETAVPRLPVIEPERVASPPLTITLTDKYRYRLEGEDTIDGTPAYVVGFAPISGRESLFRGKAWIARDDFALVRVTAVQTRLRGPIVASEQIDEFRRDANGLWLLARSEVRQRYEGAAHRTPIRRVLTQSAHEINAVDFDARRAAAYASDAIILQDTPNGFRYLQRGPSGVARGAEVKAVPGDPKRIATTTTAAATRIRTLVFGALVDPNITRPLPFAGLSYVDFDLFGSGAQFNGFFGGTYGQLAFSVPSLGGSRWHLAGRAFGIASPYNDRAFSHGREQYEEGIRQRPAHASVWLVDPLTARVSLRIGYDLDYTHFGRADVTAPDFVIPADQVVHGLMVALDVQRVGWDASVWWNPARRSGWRAWGRPDSRAYAPGDEDFQRYGVTAARPFTIAPKLVARIEAAVMGGRNLDRFSQYAFGTFENRLHGYPSALVRYDRGAVLRGTLAASARHFRIDGFADAAAVRDRGFGPGLTRLAGFGAAIEVPAPFGTLMAVEWGYGVQGINTNGRQGTHVVRVTGYKVF